MSVLKSNIEIGKKLAGIDYTALEGAAWKKFQAVMLGELVDPEWDDETRTQTLNKMEHYDFVSYMVVPIRKKKGKEDPKIVGLTIVNSKPKKAKTRMMLRNVLELNAQHNHATDAYPCEYYFPLIPTDAEIAEYEKANAPAETIINEPAKETIKATK